MGIFSTLFGSKDIVKGVMNGIDKMVLTDEERTDAKMNFMKLYEPFKVAQRYIAVICCIPYVLGWFVTLCASFYIDVDIQLKILSGDMSNIVLAIVAFYFLGGATEGVVKRFKE